MLQELMMKYLEPLRSPPPPNAPKARLACNTPSDEGWVRVHADPPIFTCDTFLSDSGCAELVAAASARRLATSAIGSSDETLKMMTADARRRSAVRTSESCTLSHAGTDAVPACAALYQKIARLTGKPTSHFEPVSVTRYTEGQQYTEHQDGARLRGGPPNHEDMQFFAQGGQRVATVLVYLNDVAKGGSTVFPTLDVEVRPKRGRCLLFFPALSDGRCDEQTLHAARPAVSEKWVTQVWVRAHADPINSLSPPRWPPGCASMGDLLRLVFQG